MVGEELNHLLLYCCTLSLPLLFPGYCFVEFNQAKRQKDLDLFTTYLCHLSIALAQGVTP